MIHQSIKILGLMSGTSLDGLDLALCEFSFADNKVKFQLVDSETIAYKPVWKERLQNVFDATAEQYFKLHSLYGEFTADSVNTFLLKHNQKPHYIASHGHTIFHRPELGFTTQIGCGATIAAKTGISTICDFRSLDVALQGQGAPLVPIGDRDLFSQYASCLNIGGIANISFTQNGITKAFDICVANMALNYLTETIGKAYDENGDMASEGNCNTDVLNAFLNLNTNGQSIGREWFETYFLPILNSVSISLNDFLATCVEYIAMKISHVLNEHHLSSVLISGGGAYNSFLKKRLKFHYKGNIETPSDEIIQFKEAIIFAYLGYLRVNEKINTLSSVTKADRDSIGACVYLGNK
ncbi:MAG: anhydro-N-acetylmuramic acid kinase [Burkholderiales bacterium]|nr:anhydro-N-acetylmuramic acid kinase [Bacteroidia bacterium]